MHEPVAYTPEEARYNNAVERFNNLAEITYFVRLLLKISKGLGENYYNTLYGPYYNLHLKGNSAYDEVERLEDEG